MSRVFFFFFWNACWRSLYFNGSLRWLTGGRKQIARQIILVIDRFTQRIINNSARFRPFEHSILFSLHAQCFDFSKNRYFISSSSPILLSNVQRGAGEGNRGIALFTLATVFAEKTVSDKIRMIFFFFFNENQIPFQSRRIRWNEFNKTIRNESRAVVETDFKNIFYSIIHARLDRGRKYGTSSRSRDHQRFKREIEEIWKIRSTTFNLIPSYRRNLSSVWMHTHKRTYWYRSSQHFTIWTRPYFKEEKQFRESSLRSVKNEVERKTSATEMSLSDAINDSRETGWFSRQMDAFVPRISNVSLVPTCRLPTRR